VIQKIGHLRHLLLAGTARWDVLDRVVRGSGVRVRRIVGGRRRRGDTGEEEQHPRLSTHPSRERSMHLPMNRLLKPSLVFLLAAPGCVGGDDADDTTNVGSDRDSGEGDTPVDSDTALPDTDTPEGERLAVNEFLADNEGSYVADDGTSPDWIEVFNAGAVDADLLGWALSDDAGLPTMHVFTTSVVVPAGGFAVLLADALPESGPTHLGFKLGSDGEEVVLTAPGGRRADWVSYGAMAPDVTAARVVDGDEAAGWTYAAIGTPGASNAGTSGG
jgi:hypothetical protein